MFKLPPAPKSLLFLAALCCQIAAPAAFAQSSTDKVNDFFGQGVPVQANQLSTPSGDSKPAATASPSSGLVPAPTSNGASPTDFTADEKRVQKKNKANAKHIQDLINEGDHMMKVGQAKGDDKMYKKGKIKKEIGEHNLADLKASDADILAQKADEPKKKKLP
jgi:hypothetical protein